MKAFPTKYVIKLVVITIFCLGIKNSNAQVISVDSNITPQELIENNLIQGCVDVSNISSQVNGEVNGFDSYGYFEKEFSNFPFENGLVITTGNVNSAGNAVNTNTLNDGETTWGTDSDLENALGISNTFNATSIEFDFISISNLIQFNYILASEEYYANYPCDYSDGFAFLIKESGTSNPYTNIALIPGTNTPVNTNTIHDAIAGFCDAENETYFEGYNVGDTNYNGRTEVLTASASIIPNVQYHIKLVIADQTDENFDSAVFIQGNSFNANVNLGPDINTCANSYVIDADIQNTQATYSWFLNGSLITGETNSTLETITSGNYEVNINIPLNNTDCFISDTIQVTVNSQQSIDNISDFELCDQDQNSVETFDLSLMTTDITDLLSNGNYSITYHNSQNDMENGTNSILNPIISSANTLPIYVRIEDIDNGCITYGNFNLIINPIPNVNSVNEISLCDDNINDGSTEVYFSDYIDNITNGDSNLQVSFHYTLDDAENELNNIQSPYVNTNPTETLFANVTNTSTGCHNIATITLNINELPAINSSELSPLTACEEEDEDGFEIFDLTEVLPELLQGLTGVTITFHESLDEAQQGINSISNPDNYQNTTEFVQQIYIRIEDDLTGCSIISSVVLHTNILITGTRLNSFRRCDDDSADGIEDYDLITIGNAIINDIENVTIEFYETEDDQTNEINAIDQSILYTINSSPHTLYVTLISPDCKYQTEVEFIIFPPIEIQPIDPINYCDTDDDGITLVELFQFNDLFLTGLTNASVDYYSTLSNAENEANILPPLYTNSNSTEILYVRVSPEGSPCFDILPFEINIIPAPSVTNTNDDLICDDDQDGFSIVNLDSLISEIVSNTTDLSIDFYNTINDATDSVNPITDTINYNAETETIYIKVENNITGCFAIVNHNIVVNTLPIIPDISNYFSCEIDGNQTAEFIFSSKDVEILNGQTDKQVLYFESEIDAINRTNSIDKNNIYLNTSGSQIIYVRVENISDTNCYEIASFELQIGSIPIFDAPSNILICDDESNDGIAVFDLTTKTIEISQNSPENLVITYHTSFENADNEVNDITNNDSYTNVENPQQIFARIENGTVCHAIASFSLNVVQVPTANIPSSITLCDDDYDEISTFDLTVSELEILDIRSGDIEVEYFESLEDLESNSNHIQDPESYNNISNPQTIQIKITNIISNCYTITPLDLIVNTPPVINDVPTIEICEDNTQSYNLNDATDTLFEDTTDLNISYHQNYQDAADNQNALNTNYVYYISTQTIYVRAENITTTCVAIQSFSLIVHDLPIANTPPNFVTCDTDYDNLFDVNLIDQNSFVLGSQNPTIHQISYHESINDAEEGINELPNELIASNNQIIFVRIENNITGCYSTTSFSTIINSKPIVEISTQAICLNDPILTVFAGETIYDGDSYLWSTNEISPSIIIDQIGTYWVTVTTSEGCQTTETFEVIESESAIIESTEVIDFSDPNNVTITVSGIGDYIYILDDNEPQTDGYFQNVPLGYHTITIIDENGCASITKEVVVIDAPKFFTPNNDGRNDSWHIVGVELLEGTVIYIYDRYGKHLTTLNWLSQGWNGTYNGNNMPTDDYWFLAEVKKNGVAFKVKGHFTLKR